MQQLTEQIVSLPAEVQSELGYKASDFIVSCQYDGEVCDVER
jgi:hypothetical protein